MENLTKFAKDVLEGFKSLHVLARFVRIGPKHMISLRKHSAYNTSALAILSVLFLISINFYSPANPIGPITGVISTLLAILLVGIVGFVVNLAAPADDIFIDTGEESRVSGLTNKWSTYLILNLAVMIFIFIVINAVSQLIIGRIAVSALISGFGLSWWEAVGTSVVSSSVLSTGFVFTACHRAGKIVDQFSGALLVFVVTNLVCIITFLVFNFLLFD